MHPRPTQELQQHGLRLIIHMMRRQHHLAGAHMPGQACITRTPGSGLQALFVNFKDFNALHEAGHAQAGADLHTVLCPLGGIFLQAVVDMHGGDAAARWIA